MKKSLAVFMLCVFFLNTLGYYGVFLGLQVLQTQTISKAIEDETFSGSQSFTVRIPLSVPYHNDDSEYEQVHGQFEKNGEVFRLVKQKLVRDTLYVVCMRDNEGKKINQELSDYVKTFSDNHDSSKQSNSKKVFSPIKEYTSTSIDLKSQSQGWLMPVEFNAFRISVSSAPFADIVYPPRPFFS